MRRIALALAPLVFSLSVTGCAGKATGPGGGGGGGGTGAVSMTATVDGRAWKNATASGAGATSQVVAVWAATATPAGGQLTIDGYGQPWPTASDDNTLQFMAETPLSPGTIPLGGPDTVTVSLRSGGAQYVSLSRAIAWGTDPTHSGHLVLDAVDIAHHRLTGHFDFDGSDGGSTAHHVTGGVFTAELTVSEAPARARR